MSNNRYEIYQISKDCPDRHYIVFESLESLAHFGYTFDSKNYIKVYEGILEVGVTLDDLFEVFNIRRPSDFKGHSLSVSDVVVLKIDDVRRAFFCDSFGWTEVPQFLGKEEVA